jgi:hypothetical protein
MEAFEDKGSAWRDGASVDPEIVIVRRSRIERIRVPIPGSMTDDYKENLIKGETTIKFLKPSPELRAELEKVLELARDPDLKRKHRGWVPALIDLKIGEEFFKGCRIDRPLNPYGSVLDSEFDLAHGDL